MRISPEFRRLIPPLGAEELSQLEANIIADGCRDPLVTWEGILIDGHNRYDICMRHGLPFNAVAMEFADRDAVLVWIIRNQFGRRNLAPFTRGELALKLEPLIAAKAKLNQVEGGKEKVVQISAQPAMKTRNELARLAGLSHDTIAKVKLIEKHADEPTKERLRTNQTSIHKEAKKIKAEQHRADTPVESKRHESCTDDLNDFIRDGVKFGTIYADPAWKYGNQATRASTDNHYGTMTVDEICALPVKELAAEDAYLHLWTTNAFLFEAKRVMESWGFEYKSVMVWVKPEMGIGNYWRVSHEFLLLGIKGKPKFADHSIKSWQEVSRGKHSAKPELFRQLVERVSPGPFLEMFARVAPHGWSAWGNQIQGREMYETAL